MRTIKLDEITKVLENIDPIATIEAGFVAYSEGKAVVPPVGELIFDNPPGDVHIKYGCLVGDDYYVVKIASGFYDNPQLNLPTSNGLNLLFNQKSGELLSILLDEGYLTDLRTALAGAIAAKYLAPTKIRQIGIVGTGIQARLQLNWLKKVTDCREVTVWGRSEEKLGLYKRDMIAKGFSVETTLNTEEVADKCNLIVTTTPASTPLLKSTDIRPGTHITAVGSDTPNKQELDAAILHRADLVVADSIAQCLERGECVHARKDELTAGKNLVELGRVIAGSAKGRTSDEQITVADLTGVAVQDIQISKAVYEACRPEVSKMSN